MAQVFEIYDASGNLTVDLASRVPRYLGQVTVDVTAGQVSHPAFAQGDAWYTMVPLNDNQDVYAGANYPAVTIDKANNRITWTARPQVGQFVFYPMQMVYGVY
ncbi:hypothetical protein [Pseudomonas putida]|uniref:Uncharacterized protein n=1 Tax=Pseudomonas putida TaxID=303 RepID=A0A6I6XVR1_PSEPU|nr:hypothetical protein [Pseudomonas putida]QHG64362.1 hypothetical protein C2H86_08015 [Pseudomonas putida]